MCKFFDKNLKGLIFDTHAHYDDEIFDNDRDKLFEEMYQKGVCCIINCSTDKQSIKSSVDLSKKYNFIHSALGYHPGCINNMPQSDNWLYELAENLRQDKVVALGEVGLDYYWEENADREVQLYYFEKQIQLSKELDIPLIVHSRNAHRDTFELLKKYKPRAVIHCFSGSAELAQQATKLGIYIGLGGVVTFKNARQALDVAREIDENFLLLETDAPYMSPEPYRGSRNNSTNILEVARKIANLRGDNLENLLIKCRENACSFFSVDI